MKAVVLAAGRGERLWPLTENNPKHLLPIANKPVLERTLESLVDAGLRDIVLVVHFKSEKIRAKIGDGRPLGCEITYVKQKKLGGTALALDAARNQLRGETHFLVVYGDDYYDEEAPRKFLAQAGRNSGIIVGTAKTEDTSRFGGLEIKKGLVTEIFEKVQTHTPGQVNAGLYLVDQTIFSAIERTKRSKRGEFELTDSLRLLIKSGTRVRAAPLEEDGWQGISYPWDLLEANRLAVESEKASTLGRVQDGAHLEGQVKIGHGSIVKSGSYLEGPVIVGDNCIIGPNAYVRPFSSVGNNVKVGAGCEIKNSVIMEGAKIPHLSYVGDSIIGERSSLGAGTITANLRFDEAEIKSKLKGEWVKTGRKKLGAVLGDDVRTGINVSTFPGVKVGARAWLGPGSVINRDVASGGRVKAASGHGQ